MRDFAESENLPVIERDEYPLENWLRNVAHHEKDRCRFCYIIRLRETAREAKKHGFEAFTTTLLYSKYQKHDWIIQAAQQISQATGVPFLYADLREGWQRGIEISKQKGLYRQPYCGCIFSEKERYLDSRKRKKRKN